MEFLKTYKEKQQVRRQAEIEEQAERLIRIQDFDNSLFLAYNGTPLAPIDPAWTTKEIIQQLTIFRNNYITSHIKGKTNVSIVL